jgi:hypothetical protein
VCGGTSGALMDWAMIILNPLEPWPGSLCLPAAAQYDVKLITRVVDYGGLFHDDVKPGHKFGQQDHRAFRPPGWVEAGSAKLEQMRSVAQQHGLTMLQLACLWNLAQPAVQSVIPTLIQEADAKSKPVEAKVDELALDLENGRVVAGILTSEGKKVAVPSQVRDLIGAVRAKAPGISKALSEQVVHFVQALRKEDLFKSPGVAETLDWGAALAELDVVALDPATVSDTLGVLLKYQDDIARIEGTRAKELIDEVRAQLRAAE